jgi:hypothetical protein
MVLGGVSVNILAGNSLKTNLWTPPSISAKPPSWNDRELQSHIEKAQWIAAAP